MLLDGSDSNTAVDRARLCGRRRARLLSAAARDMQNRAAASMRRAAGRCATARLVQQLARIQELRGAGTDRGDSADHRGAADFSDHRPRMGDGHHGAVAVHTAAAAEMVLGKMLAYFVVGVADATMAVLVGIFIFGVPLRGSVC